MAALDTLKRSARHGDSHIAIYVANFEALLIEHIYARLTNTDETPVSLLTAKSPREIRHLAETCLAP